MCELDATQCTLGVDEIRNPFHAFSLLLVPDSRVVWSDSAVRLDGTGFNHDQSSAFEGIVAESRKVVVGESSRLRTGARGRILAHWRYEDAVAKGCGADLERLKECWGRCRQVDGLAR